MSDTFMNNGYSKVWKIEKISFHLFVPPVIAIPTFRTNGRPMDTNGTQGLSASFTCDTNADPPAEVQWYINGEAIDRKYPPLPCILILSHPMQSLPKGGYLKHVAFNTYLTVNLAMCQRLTVLNPLTRATLHIHNMVVIDHFTYIAPHESGQGIIIFIKV